MWVWVTGDLHQRWLLPILVSIINESQFGLGKTRSCHLGHAF